MTKDLTIERAGVRLAARDFGGDGPLIVLLHGAGRHLADFQLLAPYLARHHRVLGMDLRNHGLSDDGPWKWDDVVADVLQLIEDVDLGPAALVGHSLGGMVAVLAGNVPGAVTAAVNIDGHGFGTPNLYHGMSAEQVAEGRRQLADSAAFLTPPPLLPPDVVDGMAAGAREQAAEWGLTDEEAVQLVTRGLRAVAGGFAARPSAQQLAELMAAVDQLDLFTLYRECPVPLQVFNATRPEASELPGLVVDMMKAYRAGLATALAELAAEQPSMTYTGIDATHGLILEKPAEVAALVSQFLHSTAPAT